LQPVRSRSVSSGLTVTRGPRLSPYGELRGIVRRSFPGSLRNAHLRYLDRPRADQGSADRRPWTRSLAADSADGLHPTHRNSDAAWSDPGGSATVISDVQTRLATSLLSCCRATASHSVTRASTRDAMTILETPAIDPERVFVCLQQISCHTRSERGRSGTESLGDLPRPDRLGLVMK
jgi:hypothetical protein